MITATTAWIPLPHPTGGGSGRLRVQRYTHDGWDTIPRTFNARQVHNLTSADNGRRIHPADAETYAVQRTALGL